MAEDTTDVDDILAAADEASAADDDTKKKDDGEVKPGTPHIVLRIVLGAAGLLLVVGFFLPWINLESSTVSGLELVTSDDPIIVALVGQEAQKWILLLIPLFGIALTAIGFLGVRYSGHISAILGILIVGYGIVTVIIFFFQKTGVGLWLILGGAFISITAGLVTFLRSRGARDEPKKLTDGD